MSRAECPVCAKKWNAPYNESAINRHINTCLRRRSSTTSTYQAAPCPICGAEFAPETAPAYVERHVNRCLAKQSVGEEIVQENPGAQPPIRKSSGARKKVATNTKRANWSLQQSGSDDEDDIVSESGNGASNTPVVELREDTSSDSEEEERQVKRRKKSKAVPAAAKRKARPNKTNTDQWCTRHQKRRTTSHFSEPLQRVLWKKGEAYRVQSSPSDLNWLCSTTIAWELRRGSSKFLCGAGAGGGAGRETGGEAGGGAGGGAGAQLLLLAIKRRVCDAGTAYSSFVAASGHSVHASPSHHISTPSRLHPITSPSRLHRPHMH
jgi:hypothetical protein